MSKKSKANRSGGTVPTILKTPSAPVEKAQRVRQAINEAKARKEAKASPAAAPEAVRAAPAEVAPQEPREVAPQDPPAAPEASSPASGLVPEVGPSAPAADAAQPTAPEASEVYRFWEVRRGAEHLGQVQAGSEDWALKHATKAFGEGVTVEPGNPIPVREAAHARKKDAAEARPAKSKKEPKAAGDTKLSLLGAAAKLMQANRVPWGTKDVIKKLAELGWWTSPGGKTPHATLHAAILREIATKGKDARFEKVGPGKFQAKKA